MHFASFPLFLLASVHAVSAGEDTPSTVVLLVVGAVTALVAGLTVVRIRDAKRSAPRSIPVAVRAERRDPVSSVTGRFRRRCRSLSGRMRAAIVTDEHRLEIVDAPDPNPGTSELVLRVRACGICGSDLKAIDSMPAGLVMGHEFCGEVVAAGSDVAADWHHGQLASALPLFACGRCRWCALGLIAHCEAVDLVGVGGSSGAYAEYVRVSAAQTVPLPDEIGDLGALVEPLAVGLHTVLAAGLAAGDRVLVIGAGPVGLAATTWARRLGAGDLVVSDPSGPRRAAAPDFGASSTVDPETAELGGPFDVVIECVGRPGMIDTAVGAVRPRGRVVIAGVCTAPDPIMPVLALIKEVEIRFAVYYTRAEFAQVARLLAAGELDAGAFVTDRVVLDGIDAAFEELKGPTTNRKVLVLPS